jgi:hypothetical protein
MITNRGRKPPRIQRGYGCLRQRGRGVGSIFKSLIRLLTPKIKKSIRTISSKGKKLLKSDLAKSIIKEGEKRLISTGKNILADVVETGDIKQSLKKELEQQKKQLERDINLLRKKGAQYIRGEKRTRAPNTVVKRKKIKKSLKFKNNTLSRRNISRDIFS